MENAKQFYMRSAILMVIFAAVLFIFVFVLYDAQVINSSDYLKQSSTQVTTSQTVESYRGIITDRNGKVLVDNQLSYTITFDPDAVPEEEGVPHSVSVAEAVLRLCRLCQDLDIAWTDELPITADAPFAYTTVEAGATARTRFGNFLRDRGWSEKELTEEDPYPAISLSRRLELGVTSDELTADVVMRWMSEDFGLDNGLEAGEPSRFTDAEKRMIVGVLYEVELRRLTKNAATVPYVFVPDASVELISLIHDGNFSGAVVGSESVRQYNTDSAAHILGRIGAIESRDELNQLNQAYTSALENGEDVTGIQHYQLDDKVGKDGVEKAFENYLCGIDGTRLITTNAEGKVTGEIYSVEPVPGSTVALTLDIDFQEDVEKLLGEVVESMANDTTKGGAEAAATRGAAAAVVSVADSSILALATYPTYSQRTYLEDYTELASDPRAPLINRALSWAFAPGSTFKPCTAIAALETGVITPTSTIRTLGRYMYYYIPGNPAASYTPKCWIWPGNHGTINVSQAIYHSCNYFFYDVGRQTGITALDEYAAGFGLGQPTGVELGENTGTVAGPEYSASKGEAWYDGNTLQAAIGQSDNTFTVLQLANYIATLLRRGERLDAHLLDNVVSYDGNSILYTHESQVLSDLDISEENFNAVKKGMGDLAATGSVSQYFKDCIVSAGCKTGSAQTGETVANGVFVAFAPFEEPEIAIAIAIEKANAGATLASTAVDIINAYFSEEDIGAVITPEGTLLP